jgi:regulator of sigma E protease
MGESVTWRIVRSENPSVEVKVVRDGEVKVFNPKPSIEKTKPWQRRGLRKIQIAPAMDLYVGDIATNSPAARAGLRSGDHILSVDGQPLYHFGGLEDYVETNTAPVTLQVQRGTAAPMEVRLQAEVPISGLDGKPSLGVLNWEDKWTLQYPSAVEQVTSSVNAMFETFGALFAKGSDIKAQHLGGAVKILEVYHRLFASEQGWRLALWFSVLMNVNLAVLNMLPIPVLDGGHILLAIIEGVRRKPISARIISAIQTSCAVLLIAFMIYIAFYDVQDLPWKRSKEKPVPVQFAPPVPGN